MSTVLPPPSKRQKREELERSKVQQEVQTDEVPADARSIRVQFQDSRTGENDGQPVLIPLTSSTPKTLQQLVNHLVRKDSEEDEDEGEIPYKFTLILPDKKLDITTNLYNALLTATGSISTEQIPIIQRTPQAVFRVRPVTRCSAALQAHKSPILAAQFSPAGSSRLCTGSGDNTSKIIDANTGTPVHTLKGHTSFVLAVAYSPDGSMIATGSNDKTVCLWDAETGKSLGAPLRGHTAFVRGIAWEPYHLQEPGHPRFASCSKDGTIRIWDAISRRIEHVLSGHNASVSSVKWGGDGHIYTSGHDKMIRVWDASKGTLVKTLKGHSHQVNHLALSTDAVLRTAWHDPQSKTKPPTDMDSRRALAKSRYLKSATLNSTVSERLCSASDDNTLYLWHPLSDTAKPVRMLGHQKQVNMVAFSPDSALIASCGFDNHCKIWNGHDGSFLYTLRAHVGPVYMVAWASDSRMVATASKDTTVKVFSLATGKMKNDLPGHKDEVYALDWGMDKVASGGADGAVRIWSN